MLKLKRMEILKTFKNGFSLGYDTGNFDNYCIYVTSPSGKRYAPKDTDYFERLYRLGQRFGINQVYEDFVSIYDKVHKKVEQEVLVDFITELSQHYDDKALLADINFSILYLGMIAEENKENSILGKRIKRLGVHTLLLENLPIDKAANFMRGRRWRELDALCRERGF